MRAKRAKRRVSAAHRLDRPELFNVDQYWIMDFVADNGSEFISKVLDKWAFENQVVLDFLDQGNHPIMPLSNHLTEALEMSV